MARQGSAGEAAPGGAVQGRAVQGGGRHMHGQGHRQGHHTSCDSGNSHVDPAHPCRCSGKSLGLVPFMGEEPWRKDNDSERGTRPKPCYSV